MYFHNSLEILFASNQIKNLLFTLSLLICSIHCIKFYVNVCKVVMYKVHKLMRKLNTKNYILQSILIRITKFW